ncbi:hypothetical protein D3C73_384890 [compost metagenome]
MISFRSGRRGEGMPRELCALIGQANRPAYFIKGVYLRCVVVAGFCVRGVSGVGLYTLRYVSAQPVWERACSRRGCVSQTDVA